MFVDVSRLGEEWDESQGTDEVDEGTFGPGGGLVFTVSGSAPMPALTSRA